jgi:hypothetical protein
MSGMMRSGSSRLLVRQIAPSALTRFLTSVLKEHGNGKLVV